MKLEPLDLFDVASKLERVVHEIRVAARKSSDGGKKITKAEGRKIGERVVALGKSVLDAVD
jgi:hypothetical protein